MSSPDLWGLFCTLSEPAIAGAAQLPAVRIPGRAGNFIAKPASNEAVFLLRGSRPTIPKPPLRLRHVEVDYALRCRVVETGTPPAEGEFIAIRCTDSSRMVLELFVRTVEALLETLPIEPTAADTESLLAALVELFRKLSPPSGRSAMGLWAELFVIDRTAAPEKLVASWHGKTTEKFDFATAHGYLEVKATERPTHTHEFSLAQLRGPNAANGLVASILLRRMAGGTGVLDLAHRIAQTLREPQLRAKLWANVFRILGADSMESSDASFDERFAEHTAAVVRALDIPSVELPLPVGVLEVRLIADLTSVAQERNRGLSAIAHLFS